MNKWILFSSSIPATNAKARMRIWRRLAACGAVQLKTGLQVLPSREDLLETITWLIGEVTAQGGEAIAIQCARIEGMPDAQIEKLFQGQVEPEFLQIQAEVRALLPAGQALADDEAKEASLALRKLRKRCDALQARDFFPSGAAARTQAVLAATEERLRGPGRTPSPAAARDRVAYRGRTWVTRARPYIDRLSSFWLVRRFIDPQAPIRFLQSGETADSSSGDVTFDMAGAEFTHEGEAITFEVMARDFALDDPAVRKIGELVRLIDIQEEATLPDDAALLKAQLDGLIALAADDQQLVERALLIFGALHAGYSRSR